MTRRSPPIPPRDPEFQDALQHIGRAAFPSPTGIVVNMMPIVTGDARSLPEHLHGYLPLIESTGLERGKVSYLTIHESVVAPGETQRRPGVHTDGTALYCWGGGPWGGGGPIYDPPPPKPKPAPKPTKGIYMASSDGRCRAWNEMRYDVDAHGSVLGALGEGEMMEPGALYWMTDRTPHESLPSLERHHRQFFRLVADEIGVWWAQHSTANPLGVQPNAPIEHGRKF